MTHVGVCDISSNRPRSVCCYIGGCTHKSARQMCACAARFSACFVPRSTPHVGLRVLHASCQLPPLACTPLPFLLCCHEQGTHCDKLQIHVPVLLKISFSQSTCVLCMNCLVKAASSFTRRFINFDVSACWSLGVQPTMLT